MDPKTDNKTKINRTRGFIVHGMITGTSSFTAKKTGEIFYRLHVLTGREVNTVVSRSNNLKDGDDYKAWVDISTYNTKSGHPQLSLFEQERL